MGTMIGSGVMYLSRKASRIRLREAQNARNNRAEIIKALADGQITRRDLVKWGIFTATGALALKNGLSPFARSAYASDPVAPTGTPPSPTYGVLPYSQPFQRLSLPSPVPLTPIASGGETDAAWPAFMGEPHSKRLSWHTEFNAAGGNGIPSNPFRNTLTGRGPMEGRPYGEYFAHQRWDSFFPKVGYRMELAPCNPETYFHEEWAHQDANAIWTFNRGPGTAGTLPPPLIKIRYGEPLIFRCYNSAPVDRAQNGGFGRNEFSVHNHNAHNASGSDGASNSHFFPGTFYDYHWSTTLARHDTINTDASDPRASGPDDNGMPTMRVPGDFRELQGTLWHHDHRFFFTAENVYKGNLGMLNYYSGPDRGNEAIEDGVNLRLPSGRLLPWGNLDFDVNLLIADMAFDRDGQYFFDIFDTDGFLGDLLHVNFAYSPYMEVLPRKYRFRVLNGCMSRFIQLALANQSGDKVPFQFVANDGNLVVNPINLNQLDQQGTGERYDIVVDFSRFSIGERVKLVNILEMKDGRRPEGSVSIRKALRQDTDDSACGPVMEFRIVDRVESVDVPGVMLYASDQDVSRVPNVLTAQIPIVQPVRTRHIEFKRGGDDPRNALNGQCIPDCDGRESFPWTIRVNGENTHSLNANRVSLLVPKPGEVEHWTLENGGGGWDHPIHMHFEEGITMNRGGGKIPATEKNVRKDVWRLREGGTVKFQVQFSEYGGAYVTHCHNTVHEDNSMLMRFDILTDDDGRPQVAVIPTPYPTPDGVQYLTPEILREGDPRPRQTVADNSGSGSDDDDRQSGRRRRR